MTEREICISYRGAKYPEEQLQVLAELNCIDKIEVIRILVWNKEELKKTTVRQMYKWLSQLDRRIAKKERKRREIKDGNYKQRERIGQEIAEAECKYHKITDLLNMVRA